MNVAVLGAGPGGYVAAIRASQLGAQVTVIEAGEVGGTCLNWGCIPTKTFVTSAQAYASSKTLPQFGIELTGSVVPNLGKIVDRKNTVVSTLVKGIRGLLKNRGITVTAGRGVLTSPRQIAVTAADGSTTTIEADRIIIATGSRPAALPALPFDGSRIISSTEALDLTELPRHLLIVGAGIIGCEFACIFRELGSSVTIVEMADRAVATEDHEISALLEKELKKKQIHLITGTTIDRIDIRDDGVHAVLSNGSEQRADKLLVSAGRTFNSSGIGLDQAGVAVGARGEIIVNSRLETTAPGVYAVGDVTGGILLAHTAAAAGSVAARNCMGADEAIDFSVVPSAIFTSPEIGSVGLREHQAEERGISVKSGRFQFRSLGKAHAMGEIAGFVKIVTDASTDRVIGTHIIGPHATDLIHEAAIAIRTGLTARQIADTIHAHPTLSEGLMEAAEDVHGMAIHVPKR